MPGCNATFKGNEREDEDEELAKPGDEDIEADEAVRTL